MTDDAQRARRRAHNTHALERCNAMGRTAGSILWQPLQKRDGKWFMPDGAALPEPPIEWRSEKLETVLDEMDAREAVVPAADWGKAYVETLDVEKWKASVDAQFSEGGAVFATQDQIDATKTLLGPATMTLARPAPPPSTISLEDLERAISSPEPPPQDFPAYVGFRQYRRSQIAELRPYVLGENLVMDGVSISAEDVRAGSPKPGDMIARNPKNHADQWLVAEQYFKDNFEPIE